MRRLIDKIKTESLTNLFFSCDDSLFKKLHSEHFSKVVLEKPW